MYYITFYLKHDGHLRTRGKWKKTRYVGECFFQFLSVQSVLS